MHLPHKDFPLTHKHHKGMCLPASLQLLQALLKCNERFLNVTFMLWLLIDRVAMEAVSAYLHTHIHTHTFCTVVCGTLICQVCVCVLMILSHYLVLSKQKTDCFFSHSCGRAVRMSGRLLVVWNIVFQQWNSIFRWIGSLKLCTGIYSESMTLVIPWLILYHCHDDHMYSSGWTLLILITVRINFNIFVDPFVYAKISKNSNIIPINLVILFNAN